MTPPPPPEPTPPQGAAAPRPSVRPRCPRCGASMGVLDAGTGAEVAGAEAAQPALYCGCCGLVVAAG